MDPSNMVRAIDPRYGTLDEYNLWQHNLEENNETGIRYYQYIK